MTEKKKDLLARQPTDDEERQLLSDVQTHGWHMVGVLEDDEGPGFLYTVGLHYTYQHPELIALGLDVHFLAQIINGIADEVKQGKKFGNEDEADNILEGYLVCFRAVQKLHYRDYLGCARWFYEGDDFPILQLVWPDKLDRYPWHPEASEALRQRQPVLCDPTSWPFQEGGNRAVVTTKQVIHAGLPIVLVSHDLDGTWQFLCGTTNAREQCALVALREIVKRDPTLVGLADLPLGWQATRTTPTDVWTRRVTHK